MAQALRIERLLIDSGYLPGVCNAVAIKAGPAVLLSKGMGLKAATSRSASQMPKVPMASYTRRPGETHGHHWYIPAVGKTSEPACHRQVSSRRFRCESRCTSGEELRPGAALDDGRRSGQYDHLRPFPRA